MKNKNWIVPITIIAVLIVFFGIFYAFNQGKPAAKGYETKVSQGEVTIDITPQEYKENKLYFQIELNTHSVDLGNYNLKEHVILIYDGKTEKPEASPKLTGHHNSGLISFKTEYEPKEYLIKINGIPDVQERVLEWK